MKYWPKDSKINIKEKEDFSLLIKESNINNNMDIE